MQEIIGLRYKQFAKRLELGLDPTTGFERNIMETYSITRFYFDKENKTTETGLTLEEAQAHCKDPESSSSTASDDCEEGQWFDGYEGES